MPTFPWTKKGSQASAGSNQDAYDRSSSRAGHAASSHHHHHHPFHHPQSPPQHAVQPRLYPQEPYQPEDFQNPGQQLYPGPQPDNPQIDARPSEPRKLFKKRFGLSSSRDDLLEDHEEQQDSSRIRRTLSTSRKKSEPRAPQRTYTTAASGGRNTPNPRRSTTLAEREIETSSADTEGLRDLADFFRSTGPTDPSRRPLSVVGSPSQWSEQSSPNSAQPGDPRARFQRRSSLDQLRPQSQSEQLRYEAQQAQQPSYEQSGQHIERGYEPYHTSNQGGLPSIPQDQSVTHHTVLRDPASEGFYQQQDIQNPYGQVDNSRGQSGLHSGAASELDAHLGVQSVHAPARALDESSNDSPRSPHLADMPSNVPASLQPPPRRGSAESSEPPTPGMHSKMTHPPPQQGGVRSHNGQEAAHGRRTPDLDPSEQEVGRLQYELTALRDKYSKVKRYYFDREEQIKTLQNALAHQKLSQSRTSLDDGEYMARLTRLDGLISQLAFGFRKDWKAIPAWLHPYVNKDAIATGKQEMTAVGRAFISRWLADEVFDKYFHPSLDMDVSRELKSIQRNIRVFTPALQTGEEEEALTDKIINWRLATIDGLQHLTNAPEAVQKRQTLIEVLSQTLINNLCEHLTDPPPQGIDGGVHMIMELAVAVLAHLPFESRDVVIECFSPGTPVSPELMRLESGVPALVNPIAELPPEDRGSVRSHSSEMQRDDTLTSGGDDTPSAAKDDSSGKKSLFGLMAGKASKTPSKGGSPPAGAGSGAAGGGGGGGTASTATAPGASAGTSQNSLLQPPGSSGGPSSKEERVRLCVFLGLQIRGKTVLHKAPVYKM